MREWWWRLVRFGFRLLYNELAFTYDLVSKAVSLGRWRCWQRTAFDFLDDSYDMPLLELAHGTGDLQLDLHQRDYAAVGFDLSADMGRITRRKLTRHCVPVRLTRGNAQALPYPDEVFPAVVCTFPTPFILQPQTLAEIYRVLQPGGRLVVVPSGMLTGRTPTEGFLEWLYEITGQREGSMAAFVAAFTAAGFRAEMQYVPCPQSVAVVVVGEKP
jgi:ubiquinone/menaquinone biosynthesis C-methylase UbiE